MLINKKLNILAVLFGLELVNYLLMEPYLSDSNMFGEFVSNSLIIIGLGLGWVWTSTRNLNILIWLLGGIVWIGLVGLVTNTNSISDGWVRSILQVKLFFVSSFWIVIGIGCVGIIVRSVYYDGILLILSLLNPGPNSSPANLATQSNSLTSSV